MQNSTNFYIRLFAMALLSLLILKFISPQKIKNNYKGPIYGDYIHKNQYQVWGDLWPFKVDQGTLFCQKDEDDYYIYFKTNKYIYSLNSITRDKYGYPYPSKILKKFTNLRVPNNDNSFDFRHLIDRAEANCRYQKYSNDE